MVLSLEEAHKMINVRYFKLLMNIFHDTPAVTCALSLDIYSGKHFLLYLAFFLSLSRARLIYIYDPLPTVTTFCYSTPYYTPDSVSRGG